MAGWGRVENETPKQTSDRIITRMKANAKAAQQDKKSNK